MLPTVCSEHTGPQGRRSRPRSRLRRSRPGDREVVAGWHGASGGARDGLPAWCNASRSRGAANRPRTALSLGAADRPPIRRYGSGVGRAAAGGGRQRGSRPARPSRCRRGVPPPARGRTVTSRLHPVCQYYLFAGTSAGCPTPRPRGPGPSRAYGSGGGNGHLGKGPRTPHRFGPGPNAAQAMPAGVPGVAAARPEPVRPPPTGWASRRLRRRSPLSEGRVDTVAPRGNRSRRSQRAARRRHQARPEPSDAAWALCANEVGEPG